MSLALHTFLACLLWQPLPHSYARYHPPLDPPMRFGGHGQFSTMVVVVSAAKGFETASETLVDGAVTVECANWHSVDCDVVTREMPHLALSPWIIRHHEALEPLPSEKNTII